MKKIIMSIICCFLFIFGFGNIKKVEATEKPQSVDGKTEYYGAMALDGNCSAHLVAYVEITFLSKYLFWSLYASLKNKDKF